jgi:hypothetical protein
MEVKLRRAQYGRVGAGAQAGKSGGVDGRKRGCIGEWGTACSRGGVGFSNRNRRYVPQWHPDWGRYILSSISPPGASNGAFTLRVDPCISLVRLVQPRLMLTGIERST